MGSSSKSRALKKGGRQDLFVRPGEGSSQAAIACSAIRLGITSVPLSRRIKSFRFISLNNRVTVSRDEPIICAISSCVNSVGTRSSRLRGSSETQESSNRASFSVELRASSSSYTSSNERVTSRASKVAHANEARPLRAITDRKSSASMNLICDSSMVVTVIYDGPPETTALSPNIWRSPAIFRMIVLPSRASTESFDRPEQAM